MNELCPKTYIPYLKAYVHLSILTNMKKLNEGDFEQC